MTRRLAAILLVLVILVSSGGALAAQDGYAPCYTYNYDYWNDIRQSPDVYRVETVLYTGDLGLDKQMSRPQSLYIRNQDIYVCDTYNNRILQIRKENDTFSLLRIIDQIQGSEVATLNTPNDVFVDVDNNIYIADTNNERIVMVDENLNLIKTFVKPVDETFDQQNRFLPNKLVVDVSGRVFTLVTNVNKGVAKFENTTEFTGFMGANKAKYNFFDYIWKTYFSTKEQRAQQEAFVPTEYANLYIDDESFIYATNTVFSEYDLLSDVAKPIRRLNGVGNDILIKKDNYPPPVGDLYWVEGNNQNGPSKLVDITVLENDIYVAVDKTRGRIFGYDPQGIMLWAFGNLGNSEGSFNNAISIEHMGRDLYVLDQSEGSITVFTPTAYGNLIYDASAAYLRGDYDGSAAAWEQVLEQNANYDLAYIGIGRALMRKDRFTEAMKYFEMAHDTVNYGRAFRLWRKIWVEENIIWIAVLLAVLLLVPVVLRRIKKIKMEVEVYERNQVAH